MLPVRYIGNKRVRLVIINKFLQRAASRQTSLILTKDYIIYVAGQSLRFKRRNLA